MNEWVGPQDCRLCQKFIINPCETNHFPQALTIKVQLLVIRKITVPPPQEPPLDDLPLPDWQVWIDTARDGIEWVRLYVFIAPVAAQGILAVLLWLLATVVAARLRPVAQRWVVRLKSVRPVQRVAWTLVKQLRLILFAVLVSLAGRAIVFYGPLDYARVLGVLSSLLTAWIVIRIATSILRNRLARRTATMVVWTLAALDITNLYGPTVRVLDAMALQVGQVRLSALLVVQGVLWLAVLLWLATLLVTITDRKLQMLGDISPSIRVLIGKLLRFSLVGLAVLLALNAVGVDMTALAIFGGGLGLGIGIGLQRVVANLVAGVVLLMDRSVKPGDVIEVDGTFGWVIAMQARFVSLVTRDRKEILIPNEDFITNHVVNWSHSDDLVRLQVGFTVSYDADPHRVRALAVEAASKPPRVVAKPVPVCHLSALGPRGHEFILRFWICDAPNGVVNVTGEVLLALWDALQAQGITVPYPQRDVHLREPVQVAREPTPSPPLSP